MKRLIVYDLDGTLVDTSISKPHDTKVLIEQIEALLANVLPDPPTA